MQGYLILPHSYLTDQSELCYPELINLTVDDEQYKALKTCQDKYIKSNDYHKGPFPFPIGSTVTVQYKDDGPWTHNVVEEANGTVHHGWYIIKVMKTGRLIMHKMRHMQYTNNNGAVPPAAD